MTDWSYFDGRDILDRDMEFSALVDHRDPVSGVSLSELTADMCWHWRGIHTKAGVPIYVWGGVNDLEDLAAEDVDGKMGWSDADVARSAALKTGQTFVAYRYAWLLSGRRSPREGEGLFSTCGDKACINPAHREVRDLGSQLEKARAALARKRSET